MMRTLVCSCLLLCAYGTQAQGKRPAQSDTAWFAEAQRILDTLDSIASCEQALSPSQLANGIWLGPVKEAPAPMQGSTQAVVVLLEEALRLLLELANREAT
ncbi:MAG: hypothetical protein JNM31_04815 [Flavobacteriales bacterium]|nr:hypothetical protein [Flavobacteriales bacterium]